MIEDIGQLTTRKRKLLRNEALKQERSSWIAHWREISEYQMPRAGRFFVSDRNKGDKRHNNIHDNTAAYALRTLASGMMAGMTSPARPWFRLSIKDKDLMESGPVKAWLHGATELMRSIYAAGNTYRTLHGMYEELGAFGTAASFLLPDFDSVIHHYPMTAGEYALATDHRGYVNAVSREFDMTVAQIVEQFIYDEDTKNFDWSKATPTLKNMWDTHKFDQWVTVLHMVEPRKKRDPSMPDAKNMKFASHYLEIASDSDERMLRESGFKRFPALTPRWLVTGNDVYGRSPGMECLGDVKQLQHEQKRKSQGIDYQTMPPLQVPSAYKDHANARLPGGVFHVDATGPGQGVRSAFEVNLNLQHLLEDIHDVRDRIRSAYYADLFLMLANDTRSGTTATEIAERHEEKLLALGPVLERLHNELLSPLIDTTFDTCLEAGLFGPGTALEIPQELQGMELDVEYISTLAQAQKMVGAQAVDNVLQRVMPMAQLWPEIRHKIDPMQIVDDVGDMFGLNPKVIVPDDKVKQKVAAEQQQMMAQQAAAAAPATAKAAKDMGDTDMQGLQDAMSLVSGYSTGQPPASGG